MSTATLERPAAPTAPATIKTPRQFADELVRDVAAENGYTYTEVRAELSAGYVEDSWWKYAARAFEEGADFSRTTWRALAPWQRTAILRGHRAQNDRELTRGLIDAAPAGPAGARS